MYRSIRYESFCCLLAGFILVTGAASFGANPFAPAEITISSTIVADAVEPIGANLTTIAGGTNFAINNHVRSSGFEPIVYRRLIRIDRVGNDGHDWFEWDQEGGTGHWNLIWTGLGNGAELRFYRIVDADGRSLNYSGQTNMADITGADHVIFLGQDTIPMPGPDFPKGGYIANDKRDGDTDNDMHRVYLKQGGLGLRFGDYAYIKLKTHYIGPEVSPPDLRQHWQGEQPLMTGLSGEWTGRLVPHPRPIPSTWQDHGETCLQASFNNPGTIAIGQYVYHQYDKGEGQWYSQLHPGASYRVEVWMSQQGLGNRGRARFIFRNSPSYAAVSQTRPWIVTDQWQKFTYDFVAPAYPTDSQWHIAHGLEFTGPGKVWIDNFILYRYDAKHDFKPFGPHEVSFDEMMSSMPATGPKPAIRFYGPIFHASSIEAMFTNYSNSSWNVSWNMGIGNAAAMTIAQSLEWAYQTGDSPQTRVVPYLTCIEEYTEDEWKALVEFLGVPYDPSVDTPRSKPHAYARYIYRGNNITPWTEEFREIVVEYGNETWHNGAGGYGWHGWGRPAWVHQGGLEYGLFARYMFDDHVKQMPEWSRYNLAQKIKFALGANYDAEESSYAELAARQGSDISYVGHANYVGPKWETADKGSAVFDDHGIQETLLGLHTGMRELISKAAATRDSLNARGETHYRLSAYEGGPSGYWTNKGDKAVIDEYYGKSVAMGLAALDSWLFSSQNGYIHQCYLGFSSGKWWSSHTLPEAGGFRPHAGWLALKLRNRYARGTRMLKTVHHSEPTLDRRGEDVPLISSYALTDGTSYSVFVLNRKLDGNHDGIDFGDGYTPVRLHLPFNNVKKITRYRLEGPDGAPVDPRTNNIDSLQVTIGSLDIDIRHFSRDFVINQNTGGDDRGICPGGIYLYVFEID